MEIMETIIPPGDSYDKKCGEIFLTTNGNVVFHCTLCEKKFPGFQIYFDHVYKLHYTPVSEKKKTTEHLHELMGYSVKGKLPKPTKAESIEVMVEVEIASHSENAETNGDLVNEQRFDENESRAASMEDELSETLEKESYDENSTEDEGEEDGEEEAEPKEKEYKFQLAEATKKLITTTKEGDIVLHHCPFCKHSTKYKRHIIDHVKRHVGTKPHKCSHCEMAFFKKSELVSHTRTHTGEKPFLCPDCGRGFSKSSSLLEHIRRHRNIRDKECDVCKMKFFNSKELRIHKAVHSDARPFGCSLCEKAFKTRLSLKAHMKIHDNKREYQCNFCYATFNQSSGLYSHINNKHSSV